MKIIFEFEKPGLLFQNPKKIISCHDPKRLKKSFDEMEKALQQGLYVAGFLSYEAGYAFERKFASDAVEKFPALFRMLRGPRTPERP